MIDSHCHLQDSRVVDLDDCIARARRVGIVGFVLAGVNPPDWQRQVEVRNRHGDMGIAFGLHPRWVDANAESALRELRQALAQYRPNALGETGLHKASGGAPLDRQEAMLVQQLALAEEFELPVILHIVGAHGRALEILRGRRRLIRGVVHGFSGSAEAARDYVSLGLHVSFSGSVTRPKAKRARLAAAAVPSERLLIETDCPDQPPHGVEGPNEPMHLVRVAQAVADLRGESLATIDAITTANARALFGLG